MSPPWRLLELGGVLSCPVMRDLVTRFELSFSYISFIIEHYLGFE